MKFFSTLVFTLLAIVSISQVEISQEALNRINEIKHSTFQEISKISNEHVSVEIPSTIIEGVEEEGVIIINKDKFPSKYTLTGKVNGEDVKFTFINGKSNFSFKGQEELKIEVFSTQIQYIEKLNCIPLWLSVLPPLIAILMALLFREVISSLFLGIFVGVLILSLYNADYSFFSAIWFAIVNIFNDYFLHALTSEDHQSVILFSMTIGAMVAVISKNGGMQGVVDRISKFAKDAKSGQFVTWLLGVSIFFDDYANTLVVGNTMRPVTDKLKISREKLAYLVDSTAAPVAAIAFVTTWIGAELGYVQNGIDKIAADESLLNINEGAYSIFMSSLQYSFYPIFTLIFMLFLIKSQRDFGPMYKAEERARQTGKVTEGLGVEDEDSNDISDELEEFQVKEGATPRAFNAIIPVFTVIVVTIMGILYTGFNTAAQDLGLLGDTSWGTVWSNLSNLEINAPETFIEKLGTIVGMANSYTALIWASLLGLLVSIILTLSQRIMKLPEVIDITIKGYKTMLTAVMILVSAWALASVTENLHTADFITSLLGDTPAWTIPFITFILAGIVAFSTGSSWGTMAILYPLMLPAAWKVCQATGMSYEDSMAIFYNVTSCVLAGSVLGDHCSPISDTTILSSLASSCNHIDHVRTQLPYAITCGAVSIFIGTIPASFGISSLITIPIGILALFFIVKLFGKKVAEPEMYSDTIDALNS